MGHKQRALFYQQFATAVGSLPISQAVSLAAVAAGGDYREWEPRLVTHVDAGGTLAEALRDCGEQPFAIGMIAAGEASGRLPEASKRIARTASHRQRLRSLVIGKSIYPVILIHVATVLPPGALAIGGILPAWAPLVGPGLLWSIIAAAIYIPRVVGKTALWSRLAMRNPARFFVLPLLAANTCQVLAAAASAGMLAADMVDLAASACGNEVMAERLRKQGLAMRSGNAPNLTTALGFAGLPASVVARLHIGEETGKLEHELDFAAIEQLETFESRTSWGIKILNGVVYGFAMLIAVIIIVAMFLGYLRVLGSIG